MGRHWPPRRAEPARNRTAADHLADAIPLIKSTIIFVAVWQFIVTWNEFFLALVVMTDSSHKTVTLLPMQYSGMYMANPAALFAILVIIAVPLLVLYTFVQKYFVAGLLSGAVKG